MHTNSSGQMLNLCNSLLITIITKVTGKKRKTTWMPAFFISRWSFIATDWSHPSSVERLVIATPVYTQRKHTGPYKNRKKRDVDYLHLSFFFLSPFYIKDFLGADAPRYSLHLPPFLSLSLSLSHLIIICASHLSTCNNDAFILNSLAQWTSAGADVGGSYNRHRRTYLWPWATSSTL